MTTFRLLGSVLSGELLEKTPESRLLFNSFDLFCLFSVLSVVLICMLFTSVVGGVEVSSMLSLCLPCLKTCEDPLSDKDVSMRMVELLPTLLTLV